MSFEYGMGAKWLELLSQIAPSVTRVAILRNAAVSSDPAQLGIVQAGVSSFRMEVSAVNMGDAADIERGLVAFARAPVTNRR